MPSRRCAVSSVAAAKGCCGGCQLGLPTQTILPYVPAMLEGGGSGDFSSVCLECHVHHLGEGKAGGKARSAAESNEAAPGCTVPVGGAGRRAERRSVEASGGCRSGRGCRSGMERGARVFGKPKVRRCRAVPRVRRLCVPWVALGDGRCAVRGQPAPEHLKARPWLPRRSPAEPLLRAATCWQRGRGTAREVGGLCGISARISFFSLSNMSFYLRSCLSDWDRRLGCFVLPVCCVNALQMGSLSNIPVGGEREEDKAGVLSSNRLPGAFSAGNSAHGLSGMLTAGSG